MVSLFTTLFSKLNLAFSIHIWYIYCKKRAWKEAEHAIWVHTKSVIELIYFKANKSLIDFLSIILIICCNQQGSFKFSDGDCTFYQS